MFQTPWSLAEHNRALSDYLGDSVTTRFTRSPMPRAIPAAPDPLSPSRSAAVPAGCAALPAAALTLSSCSEATSPILSFTASLLLGRVCDLVAHAAGGVCRYRPSGAPWCRPLANRAIIPLHGKPVAIQPMAGVVQTATARVCCGKDRACSMPSLHAMLSRPMLWESETYPCLPRNGKLSETILQ